MRLDYSSTGNSYPNPIDAPDEFPCLQCSEDTGDYHEEFCSKECEAEYRELEVEHNNELK